MPARECLARSALRNASSPVPAPDPAIEGFHVDPSCNATSEGYEPNSSIQLTHADNPKDSENDNLIDILNDMDGNFQLNENLKQTNVRPVATPHIHDQQSYVYDLHGVWHPHPRQRRLRFGRLRELWHMLAGSRQTTQGHAT